MVAGRIRDSSFVEDVLVYRHRDHLTIFGLGEVLELNFVFEESYDFGFVSDFFRVSIVNVAFELVERAGNVS